MGIDHPYRRFSIYTTHAIRAVQLCFFLSGLMVCGSGWFCLLIEAQTESEVANLKNAEQFNPAEPGQEPDDRFLLLDPQVLETTRNQSQPEVLGFSGEFSEAIRGANVVRLRQLLEAGVLLVNWEGTGDDGLMAYCVRTQALEMGVLLLQFGVDPNRWGREGASPLQMAIAMGDAAMVRVLLTAGADANQKFLRPVSDGMLALTESKSMQWFLKKERRVYPLMMAANTGDLVIIKDLIDHGAETEIRSGRYKLYPLNFASRRSDVKAMQVILGKDPEKESYHIVLDLSEQRMRLYDAQKKEILSSRVSTGKAGFTTPTGVFVITDKHRKHRSTIYKVKMPYFQRLSCSQIGFHSGYCPGYPASHGCIRMPYQSAKKLFATVPAGTRVVIHE